MNNRDTLDYSIYDSLEMEKDVLYNSCLYGSSNNSRFAHYILCVVLVNNHLFVLGKGRILPVSLCCSI